MAAGQRIREHRDEILRVAAVHGAGNILLFGSVARGEDTPESDVDLGVDVTGDTTPWFPGSLIADLEALLGQRVQVVIRRSLSPLIRDAVLREAIVRNLQVPCESAQRIGDAHRERTPRSTGDRLPACETSWFTTTLRWILRRSGWSSRKISLRSRKRCAPSWLSWTRLSWTRRSRAPLIHSCCLAFSRYPVL
jgi:predicted nucleotidyltransferase